jgi:gliding motility-associated protein GldL
MNLTELTQSAGWKNFMAKLYGIGASIVIIGALFKIQHIEGGGLMISLGLGTEAVIFFFSAFEPLHEELDWTLVYPELAGMTDPDELDEYRDEALAGRGVTLERFDDMFNQADIKPETIKNLGTGLNNLSATASNLADISQASVATRQYADNVQKAAEGVGGLTDNYSESTSKLASAANTLSESYQRAAEKITSSGSEVAASYTEAAARAKSITSGNETFGSQLETMNKNLLALNEAYAAAERN